MWTKAYSAFHNAKQRCQNTKHPDYPTYGKLGIKVLFASFEAFLAHIGLPPSKEVTLDRINPSGNYEIGNVRWASKAVQAHNKKTSPTASVLSISKQIQILADGKKARSQRETISKCWWMYVSAISRGTFVPSEIDFIAATKLPLKSFSAGWELGQVRDLAEPASFFHMPSLTQMWRQIRLEGGPLPFHASPHMGIIQGLPFDSPAALEIAKGGTFLGENGAALIGGKSEDWLALGGVEGIMMVFASRFSEKGMTASLMPLMRALIELADLGPRYKWHEINNPLLDVSRLFIPDFQIDYGDAVQPSGQEWSLLANLLDYRVEYGKRTYLGIQNVFKLPTYLRDKILSRLVIRELPEEPKYLAGDDFFASGPTILTSIGFAAAKEATQKFLLKT